MNELVFREEDHSYWIGERRLPSVTGVLSIITDYAGVPRAVLQKAADRGTAVHRACELAALGTLDWESLDDELIPYVMAYEQFRHDMRGRMEILAVERRTHHPALLYAGTYDLEAIIDGKRALIDLKSSVSLMPTVGPQLAGYQEAENAHRAKAEQIKTRYGLKLGKDGKYKLQQYKDAGDWHDFAAALRILRFKEMNDKNFCLE